MWEYYNSKHIPYEKNNAKFLSDKGSESVVYTYNNNVLKIFKNNYKFNHLTKEEITKLMKLQTSRILIPNDFITNAEGLLSGYQMPYISKPKSILDANVSNILNEIELLQKDAILLAKNNFVILGVNSKSTIFNGELYIVNPDIFAINKYNEIKNYITTGNRNIDEITALTNWNLKKIDQLAEMLIFGNNNQIDAYEYRQIIQFLKKEQTRLGYKTDIDVLKKYLDPSLSVLDAGLKLLDKTPTPTLEEQNLFLS